LIDGPTTEEVNDWKNWQKKGEKDGYDTDD